MAPDAEDDAPTGTRLPDLLIESPLIAVLRARHASQYPPVVEALLAGGVRSIEVTLTTDGVFDHLPQMIDELGDRGQIGVGTVTSVEQAEAAIERGAAFIVTPVTLPSVIQACLRRGIPVYSGGLTPTELHSAWAAGATALKLFPANTVGSGYLAQLHGPFPGMPVVPSGGVDLASAEEWMHAGAAAVSVGSPLLGDAFRGGDPHDLSARAAEFLRVLRAARKGVR